MTTATATPTTTGATASQRIAEAVALLLYIQDKTQTDLAAYLHVGKSTVSRILNGERRLTADTVESLAQFLDVPVSVLYDGPEPIRARVQNWKKLTPSDLRIITGEANSTDTRRATLHAVK